MAGEWASGNIFIRPNPLPKVGDAIVGDLHNFDHTTFIVSGAVNATRKSPDGVSETVRKGAGEHVLILAHWRHTFVAVEPNTLIVCIYSHRNAQGEIVQAYDGWMPGYV